MFIINFDIVRFIKIFRKRDCYKINFSRLQISYIKKSYDKKNKLMSSLHLLQTDCSGRFPPEETDISSILLLRVYESGERL